MGVRVPDDLVWVMDKVGLEWPDINEDELRRIGEFLARFADGLAREIAAMDRTVNVDVGPRLRDASREAVQRSWNAELAPHLRHAVDLFAPAPADLERAATIVRGAKTACIVAVTRTMAAVLAATADPPSTAGAVAMVMETKAKVEADVDAATQRTMSHLSPVFGALREDLPVAMAAVNGLFAGDDVVGDSGEDDADLDVRDELDDAMEAHAAGIDTLTTQLMADVRTIDFAERDEAGEADPQRILDTLASAWVSEAAAYAGDAPGVTAFYIYGSHERGASTANAYFEQYGQVDFPGRLEGTDTSHDAVGRMQRIVRDDMEFASDAFAAAGLPAPTEYRLEYRVDGANIDLQLSHDELYGPGGREKSQIEDIEYWVGDRALRQPRGDCPLPSGRTHV